MAIELAPAAEHSPFSVQAIFTTPTLSDTERLDALLQALIDRDEDFLERCEALDAEPKTVDEAKAILDVVIHTRRQVQSA
jgi:hypothetical protein